MRRMVFLCSGGGGNLKFAAGALECGALPGHELAGVIADRPCGALDFARGFGIPAVEVEYRRDGNADLKRALAGQKPDVVITNFHKILDPELVGLYRGRLLNLHYSLLPAFAGLIGAEPVKKSLETGCQFTGATAHWVTEQLDGGPILAQGAVPIPEEPEFDSLMQAVFRAGCFTLLNALCRLAGIGKADHPEAGGAFFSPSLCFDPVLFGGDIRKTFPPRLR